MIALVICLLVIIIIMFWRAIQLMDERAELLEEIKNLRSIAIRKCRALERLERMNGRATP